MGTSKSYITVQSKDYTKTKRAITALIKASPEKKEEKLDILVKSFSHAVRTEATTQNQMIASTKKVIGLLNILCSTWGDTSKTINYDGIVYKLDEFKTAYEFFSYMYSHDDTFTIFDQLSKESLFETLERTNVNDLEELTKIDLNSFLLSYLSILAKNVFLHHYFEIITQKVPNDAVSLLDEIACYIMSKIEDKVSIEGIDRMFDESVLSTYIDNLVSNVFDVMEG